MALQEFNNLESNLSIRTKLNENTIETEKLIVKDQYVVATADLASGSVTSQTSDSITDTSKSWTVNQFADKGVRLLTADGGIDYAIVASNTATQLVFDDTHAGFTFATYRILSTFEIESINSVVGVDIESNDCAVILPDLDTTENRKFVRVYLEKSLNNGKRAAIICRKTQKQLGRKFGFLNYRSEAVQFWSHLLAPSHWDILSIENVKRYTSATVNADTEVTSTSYVVAFPFANLTQGTQRRFETKNVSGNFWFKYLSITPLTMQMSGALIVTRSGGGSSTVEVAVRIKRSATGLVVDSDDAVKIKFSGDSSQTVPITIPFDLEPYDEVTVIAKRDSGTVTFELGSNLLIKEM